MRNGNYGEALKKSPQLLDNSEYIIEDKILKAEEELKKRTGPYIRWFQEDIDDSGVPPSPDPPFYLNSKMGTMSRTLNNFNSGIGLLAGLPHTAKSTFMISMMTGALRNDDEDLCIIDISIDDDFMQRYVQHICCRSNLTYDKVNALSSLDETEYRAYEAAKDSLLKDIKEGRLLLLSGTETFYKEINGQKRSITYSNRAYNSITGVLEAVRRKFSDRRIFTFVDAWHDIDFESNNINEEERRIEELKEATQQFQIPIFASAHIRKAKGSTVTADDIKGTGALWYAPRWIGILRNRLAEDRNSEYTWMDKGKKRPVVTVDVAKSKVSNWGSGIVLPYKLNQESCRVIPLSQPDWITYVNKWEELEAEKEDKKK